MSPPIWINGLNDSVLKADMTLASASGIVTEASIAKLFTDLSAELSSQHSTLSSSQFNDIQLIAINLNVGETASSYVTYITDALIQGNIANALWTGGLASTTTLGNLTIGDTATQISELAGKWFLGTDLPSSYLASINSFNSFSVSYSAVSSTVFGSNGPSINDINQGTQIADCFFLASLAEVAFQNPSLISSMIINNGNNTYGVRFFVNGKVEYVTVNNYLPNGVISNQGANIWASLIEKAYAQLQAAGSTTGFSYNYGNSFSSIASGGNMEHALEEITGASTITDFRATGSSCYKEIYNNVLTPQILYYNLSFSSVLTELIADLANGNDLVLCSITDAVDSAGRITLYHDHVFSIYGYDQTTGLLEIRNPWGTMSSGQYWDTTFEVSLATLLADGDTIAVDNVTSSRTIQITFTGVGNAVNQFIEDVSSSQYTSETITSTTATNDVFLTNSGGSVTSLTINGNTGLIATIDGLFVSHLNSINAATDTGGVFFYLNNGILKPGFTFTGGSGPDFLMINKASLDLLTSGSQLNGGTAASGNILAISDLGTLTGSSISTGEYKTLNATKGFQILEVDGTGNNVVINDAYLTNDFATHIRDEQFGGTLTVNNVGSTYILDIMTGSTNQTLNSFTISAAASQKTALTVNLFGGATVANTLTTTGGIASVILVPIFNDTPIFVDTINSYHGSDNQTLTITGSNVYGSALTIGSVTPNTKTGDTIDASTFTGSLTLGTVGPRYIGHITVYNSLPGDTGQGDVIKLGSGTCYLAVSSAVTGDKITLLASHTVTDTIDTTLISSAIFLKPYTSAAAQKADITQITNFYTNSDVLSVGSLFNAGTLPPNGTSTDLTGHTWTVHNGFVTAAGLTGATGLTAFLADVASSTTFATNDVLAYNDGANTYIAIGDYGAGKAFGENIIELVGLHTATALGNTGGATTIDINNLTIPVEETILLKGTAGDIIAVNVSDPLVTSVNIIATGSASSIYLSNTGGCAGALTISGNGSLAVGMYGALVSQLKSINASTDTGGVDIGMSLGILKQTFTFTGGSGQDYLMINTASLDALNTGSQLNGGTATSGNILAISDLGTLSGSSASTGEYKIFNATKGFQILGVGGTGNNVVIHDTYLSNGFANHVLDTQNGGSLMVTNIGKTYTLDIVGFFNSPSLTNFILGSAASTNTALTVNLTPNYTLPGVQHPLLDAFTVGALTTTGGISSVALVSNAAAAGSNTIVTYHGSDNQTLTITGNNSLAILNFANNALTGDTINASGFNQGVDLGTFGGFGMVAMGAGDSGKGDVIKLGSNNNYLAASSAVKGDIITLLANHTTDTNTIDTTLIASAIAAKPYSSAAAQKADITQIINFGWDVLTVGIAGDGIAPHIGSASDLGGSGWSVSSGGFVTKVGSTPATGLTAFLASVASSKTFTANDVLAYNDGANTYIVAGDHTAGTALGEHIIELVGVHTATTIGITTHLGIHTGGTSTIDIA